MAKDFIKQFPDPILRKSTSPVRHFDKALKHLFALLYKIMLAQDHGIGIAAPQIGISMQAAVIDVSRRTKTDYKPLYLVNPKIVGMWEQITSREGCMSIPQYTANVRRYNKIKLNWMDEQGKTHIQSFEGIEARCIQHEVDHLLGRLFLDRVTSLKADMRPRRR